MSKFPVPQMCNSLPGNSLPGSCWPISVTAGRQKSACLAGALAGALWFLSAFVPDRAWAAPGEVGSKAHSPAHCAGEFFAARDLPPPKFRAGISGSEIRITTNSAEAQRLFNYGVGLLHAYWPFEGYRAFREAQRLDPEAAMPYWGIYMSLALAEEGEALDTKRWALKEARARAGQVLSHEQGYIAAIVARDGEEGRDGYLAALRALLRSHPEEIEAALFLAVEQLDGYEKSGIPKPGQREAERLLIDLLKRRPDHPGVHHYWIHASELAPDRERALESVEAITRLGFGSGHLTHMPGHIHFLLGNYQVAHEAFLRAKELDARYLEEEQVHPVDNWNYLHNLDYLFFTALELGRAGEAAEAAELLGSISLPSDRHGAAEKYRLIYEAWLAPAKVDQRLSRFKEAADKIQARLPEVTLLSTAAARYYTALRSYLLLRNALAGETPTGARELLQKFEAEYAAFNTHRPQPAEQQLWKLADSVLRTSLMEARALHASHDGKHELAKRWLEKAFSAEEGIGYKEPPPYIRPVAETAAEIALRAGDMRGAAAAYEKLLARRVNSIYGLCPSALLYAQLGEGSGGESRLTECKRRLESADPEIAQRLTAAAQKPSGTLKNQTDPTGN